MKNDILNSLNRLICHTFLNHRGFLLERSDGRFKLRDQYFENIEAVDRYIDECYAKLETALDKSLNKLKQNVKIENNSEAR